MIRRPPRSTQAAQPDRKPVGTWSTSLVADTPVDGSFHDPGYRSFFLAAGEYIALDRSFPARKSLPGTKLHSSNSSPAPACAGVDCSKSHLHARPGWSGERSVDAA